MKTQTLILASALLSLSQAEMIHKVFLSPIIKPLFGEGLQFSGEYALEFLPSQELTFSFSGEDIEDCGGTNIDSYKCTRSGYEGAFGYKYLWYGLFLNPEITLGYMDYYSHDFERGTSDFEGTLYGLNLELGYQYEYDWFVANIAAARGRNNFWNTVDLELNLGFRLGGSGF